MVYSFDKKTNILTLNLDGEIDVNSCKMLRNIIDGYIIKYQPVECILDFKAVSFMDSSGIGLILGRYNLLKLLNSKLVVLNTSSGVSKILKYSNLGKLISIGRK